MKIAITAESTIDLPQDVLNKYNIKTVSFGVVLGNVSKLDGEVNVLDIINFVNENKILPKTNAVNEFQYEEFFKEVLKDYDAIIHFSLSSEISSAYSNALKVSEKLKNVKVIDTRNLSTGIALLALYASNLVKQGKEFDEIIKMVEKRIPFVQTSFVLKRLDYLYKGGRCNSLQLFGANLLKLRPQIIVNNGKMVAGKKYIGNMDECVKKYCVDTLTKFNKPDKSLVFLTYTTATEKMLANAKNVLENAGFKNIIVTNAGATITSHCGENCLGILYINDGE